MVVVVGGGPGGLVLAYLLARAGIKVTVLEAQADFDRDFRGDSLHAATLELMEQLGLVDELLALPHYKAKGFHINADGRRYTTADYSGIGGSYPYVAIMQQSRFLDFLAGHGTRLDTFDLRMNAKVTGLLEHGVRYRDADGEHELPADLVIAADGRFSRMRRLAEMDLTVLGGNLDIVWSKLPRLETDPPDGDVSLFFGRGSYIGLLGRDDDWQIGYNLPKGGFPDFKAGGIERLRAGIADLVPWLADRTRLIGDWSQTSLLSVQIARLERWYKPGLLFIGDAAHVISPVGGNGILMAIQDAVVAANHLIPALREGQVGTEVLAAIQAEREPAIASVQKRQVMIERGTARRLASNKPYTPALPLRIITAIPALRRAAARSNAYGPGTPKLDLELLA
ncbi:FAD-dependent oxidoreductase [Pseudonocardiaceae bacterium YIM PH 21723]|nr:FAD-dependent oxidoreductase [Pseudonocardiaceae bacterium YIM PH 21723]